MEVSRLVDPRPETKLWRNSVEVTNIAYRLDSIKVTLSCGHIQSWPLQCFPPMKKGQEVVCKRCEYEAKHFPKPEGFER